MSTTKVPTPPEFDAASEEQRIAFVQERWDRITQDPDRVTLESND